MKLVDVSKLQKIEIDHERYDYVRGCMEGYNDCIEDLKTVPEVKAIPIEWIKNYASHKASKDLIDCYWHFWEDDVLKMVADWEEENERMDNR